MYHKAPSGIQDKLAMLDYALSFSFLTPSSSSSSSSTSSFYFSTELGPNPPHEYVFYDAFFRRLTALPKPTHFSFFPFFREQINNCDSEVFFSFYVIISK